MAILNRSKFAKRSEQLSPDQGSLNDLLDTDIVAIDCELITRSIRQLCRPNRSATQACAAVDAVPTHSNLSRTENTWRGYGLPASAIRRRHRREAGLNARHVHRRFSAYVESGLLTVRHIHPGADTVLGGRYRRWLIMTFPSYSFWSGLRFCMSMLIGARLSEDAKHGRVRRVSHSAFAADSMIFATGFGLETMTT